MKIELDDLTVSQSENMIETNGYYCANIYVSFKQEIFEKINPILRKKFDDAGSIESFMVEYKQKHDNEEQAKQEFEKRKMELLIHMIDVINEELQDENS